jgi:trimeric autotransporter adhesin
MKHAITVFCALLALSVSTIYAAAPTALNFQGRLSTTVGAAVPDGSYSVVFTIYDAPSGGISKWTETQSVTTSSGLFAVLLGSVSPLTDSVFNSPSRYLGVKVGPDPELAPRTQLVSVPYAARISTIDGATGGGVTGDLRFDPSSGSSGNIYKGGQLFLHNPGSGTTFLGQNAGPLTVSGTDNTGLGVNALQSVTTGSGNTAVGTSVLALTQDGGGNTAVGVSALLHDLSGSENSALGGNALSTNTYGNYNMAFGSFSLAANETGSFNCASGYASLRSNISGSRNQAFGTAALYSNQTGDGNAAFGHEALKYNVSGSQNTAVGDSALMGSVSTSRNTAVGALALSQSNSGSDNTAVGDFALQRNTSGLGNTATGSATLLANTNGSGNTGDGWNALGGNDAGSDNTASGAHALSSNSSGSGNAAFGANALTFNHTGNNNTAIGNFAGVTSANLTNTTAIGSSATVSVSNKIRLGNSSVTVIEGQVAYTFTSDRNQKENFQPVDGEEVLNKIQDLSLTSWNYKNNDPAQFRHYGPVAQEFYAAFGHDAVGTSGDSISINSGDEAGIMMIAIQTLARRTAEIDAVKAENRDLRSQLDDLKKAVGALEVQSRQNGNSKTGLK